MSELKATPGPWFVHPSGASIRTSARHEIYTYPHIIARLPYATQRVANAHLIAAAPALAEYVRVKADQGDPEAIKLWEMACGC